MKTNTFQKIDGRGLRIAVVTARFNSGVTDRLRAGCLAALDECGVQDDGRVLFAVPGSFELPQLAARIAAEPSVDAIVALGCIIKGETDHDVYIANAVASELERISTTFQKPVVFGVLTCNTPDQAEARVRGEGQGNKGYEAGMSAIEMALLFRSIPGRAARE